MKEIREIAEWEGMQDVVVTCNGHYKVVGRMDNHRLVFSVSSSPSCPHSLANFTRDIRRRISVLASQEPPVDFELMRRNFIAAGFITA